MSKKFSSKPIGGRASKQPSAVNENDEALEKLDVYYRRGFDIVKPDKSSFLWLMVILLSVLFALATSLAYNMFFMPAPAGDTSQQQKVIIEHQENVTVTSQERLSQLTENISPSVVNFYLRSSLASGPFYQDKDSLGSGFILSSDGWLVTTQNVLKQADIDQLIVLTADYRLYSVKQIVNDPASPLAFVYIEADNLPAVKLGSIQDSFSGQKVFGVIASYPNPKLASLHLADIHHSSLSDVVASSEKFSHFVACREGYDPSLIGAPLVNLAGEVIGVVSNISDAVPADYFSHLMDKLSRAAGLSRVYLGVHYISLAKYPKINLKSGQLLKRGALLSGYKNLTAVAKNSPAAKAGLRVGDIILSVEDEPLNGHKTLAQIIQEYNPGDVVEMTILRAGQEKKVEVELGEVE